MNDVRFTPNSGHVQRKEGCPLSAKSGHQALKNFTSLGHPNSRPVSPSLARTFLIGFSSRDQAF
jgi:hypothetical protein